MKTTYIVKAYEEELGSELFIVRVPAGTSETEVFEKLSMAEKYVNVSNFSNADEYDEHFDEMLEVREDSNGINAFNYYLEEFCGYKIESLVYDFEFEW